MVKKLKKHIKNLRTTSRISKYSYKSKTHLTINLHNLNFLQPPYRKLPQFQLKFLPLYNIIFPFPRENVIN